jgi:hypothetical protein
MNRDLVFRIECHPSLCQRSDDLLRGTARPVEAGPLRFSPSLRSGTGRRWDLTRSVAGWSAKYRLKSLLHPISESRRHIGRGVATGPSFLEGRRGARYRTRGHVADVDRPVGSARAEAISPLEVVDSSVQADRRIPALSDAELTGRTGLIQSP